MIFGDPGLLGFLILISLVFALGICVCTKFRLAGSASFVVAVFGSFCSVVFVAEVVGLFGILSFWTVATPSAILAGIAIYMARREFVDRLGGPHHRLRQTLMAVRREMPATLLSRINLVVVACGIILVFASGLLIAPSNWDSLSYHLPRTLHWLQQGSLAYFETPYEPQNTYPPAHSAVQVLLIETSPLGAFSFVSQFLAGIAFAAAIMFVSRGLTDRLRAFFSVAFVLSLPLYLVMLSTTQADLVATLPAALGLVGLRLTWEGRSRPALALAAISLGAAPAFKVTSVLFAAPIALLIFVGVLKWTGDLWRTMRVFFLYLLGSTILISLPYLIRFVYGSLGSEQVGVGESHINTDLGVNLLLASMLQYLGFYVYLPFDSWNAQLSETINQIGLQLNAADFSGYVAGVGDSNLGAPVHLAIAILGIVMLTVRRQWSSRSAQVFFISVSQFLLISLVIDWNPWFERFAIVPLATLSPVIAASLVGYRRLCRIGTLFLALLFVGFAAIAPDRGLAGTSFLPLNFGGATYVSPLNFARIEQMGGAGRRNEVGRFAKAAREAAKLRPERVLICIGPDQPEFVIWTALKERLPYVRIEHLHPSSRDIASPEAAVIVGPGCNQELEGDVQRRIVM